MRFGHLLDWNYQRLRPACLEQFCKAIRGAGAPLDTVFGFIDGTLREIARPSNNQRLFYNGWKRMHCIKFQSVMFPDGIMLLAGPWEGSRHDAYIWALSGLEHVLRQEGESVYVCFTVYMSAF